MCKMWRFLAVLRSFFHFSLLYTLSFHHFPPTSLPSSLLPSLTSSCHLFLGLPLNLIVSKFIYNTSLEILFSSILCTCPKQRNLFNLIVSVLVEVLTIAQISLLVNILQFYFHCHRLGLKFFSTLSFQECLFVFYLSLLISRFILHMLKFCLLNKISKYINIHTHTSADWSRNQDWSWWTSEPVWTA